MATILIVDDRPANREYLITLLGYLGHRLVEAVDGVEGLAQARAQHPDLIIADIVMPAMDGYELARQVRAEAAIASTQIIFLTSSYIVEETRRLAAACGVEHVVAKPVEPQLLIETVNAALATPLAEPPPAAPDEFHREHMRLLTDTLAKKVEELEAEIEERKQTEAALRVSENRVRSTMDAMLEGAQIIDPEWRYVYVNDTAAAQGRKPKAELIGFRMGEVYPGIEQSPLFATLHRCMAERVVARFENEFAYPDGTAGWFDLSVQPVPEGLFILSQDITARKRVDEERRAANARLQALATATHAFAAAGLDLQALLDEIARKIAETLGDNCNLGLVSDDGEWLDIRAAHSPIPQVAEYSRTILAAGHLRVTDPHPTLRVLSTGEPLRLTGLTLEQLRSRIRPEFWEVVARYPIHSILVVAMRNRGQNIGLLSLARYQADRGDFTDDDVTLAQDLADRAALAITNARLFEQVHHEQERFRELAANLRQLFWMEDARTGQLLYASPAYSAIWGRSLESFYADSRSFLQAVHPDDVGRVNASFVEQQAGRPTTTEYRIFRPDGEMRWILDRGFPIFDEHGQVYRIGGIAEDITERKAADDRLAYQAEVLEHVHDCIIATDGQSRVTVWNRGAERTYGWTAAEVIGRPIQEVFQATTSPDAVARTRQALAEAGQVAVQTIHHRKDGTPIHVEGTVVAQHGDQGEIKRYLFAYRDISERVQTERALRDNEKRFRALIENAPDGITLVGADGKVLFISPSGERIMGYSAKESIGQDPAALTHPGDLPGLLRKLVRLRRNPSDTITVEYRFRHQDGTWRWLESRVSNLLAETSVQALIFNFQDISERKQAEAALAQSNDLLSRAERVGQIGSWRWDARTDQAEWSDGAYRLFGLTPETFSPTAAAYFDLIHPDDRARVQQLVYAAFEAQTPLEFESRVVLPDGEVRVHYARAEVVSDAQGQPAQLLGIDMDITERVKRERELQAIAAVSTALRSALSQAEMLPAVLEQMTVLLGAGACSVVLRVGDSDELVVASSQGEMADPTGQRLPAGAGITGRVVSLGRPYVTADVLNDPYFHPLSQLPVPRAAACVPLITRQHVMGALWAGRDAPFSDVELRVLTAIADIAASAIQRAALHEQTEQRLQRLVALRNIDAAIMNSVDLQLTLGILLDQVIHQLRVDAGDILLLSRGSQVLEHAASRGFRSRAIERSRLRLGEGYAGQAALERRLILVADLQAEPQAFRRAQLLVEETFVSLVCVPLVAKGQLVGVLEVFHRTPLRPDADWLAFFETLAGQAAIAVADARLFSDLQRSNTDLLLAYDTTLEGWSAALDLRDRETEGHSQRVTQMTLQLAEALGVGAPDLESMRRGALLHDIGKMGIPDGILLKPGKLTDEEWAIMRQHPVFAYQLLSPIAFLRPALDIPYCHHEKWDGTGYPRGLKGEAIPLAARIFAVVDVWDALRSKRSYRDGWPEAKVRDYIRAQSGTHFDPAIVEAFMALRH